jgi:prepilin-type N-terminal cleavage/methylation domain-containing protein
MFDQEPPVLSRLGTEMLALPRVRDERGFTLVEVMVTMLILVVGIGGSVALIDGANARTLMTKDREAGNALTREVIEATRSIPYRQLGATSTITQLQAMPGLADSTPTTVAWTVVRRKQTYTITLAVCSVDDDQDGFGDTSGGGFCTATGGAVDRNPDDYKRVTVNVAWTRGGVTRTIKHSGIVNNEASSAGPSVEFTGQDPTGEEISTPTPSVKFNVEAEDGAVAIRFAVDGVVLDSVTGTTSTVFAWDIDSGSVHVPDGTYVVSITAFDAEDTPGPTRSRTIRLNRDVPVKPEDVFGGWNSRIGFSDVNDIVEIQWARNTEPDVTGYRVYRVGATGGVLVSGCDFATDPSQTECRDLNPPADPSIGYYVVALDENPFDGSPREGAPSDTLTAVRANTQPNQPPTLTANPDNNDVVLGWDPSPAATPSYSGSDVIFYRVYRNGTAIGDRIARTSQDSLTSFRDGDAAAGGHVYYVTAVDENFSESAPLGPVGLP